ncbi:hypothetical protein [Legionella taurinensis]|uniref:hypothetical protein n=1 Tax=Legionella taurinensis TaxID=70611 RepID=UPI00145B7BFD|nr:hypothetical protein [Legionella taurinensis]MDX1838790.1 hypothetical protein [Legionella taurinensis]
MRSGTTFPVEGEAKGSDPYHQIYFKRQEKDCVKFDAEERYGEKKEIARNCLTRSRKA